MVTVRTDRPAAVMGALSALTLLAASCSGGGGADESATSGGTINVALHIPSPPKASLDAFTKSTGITVKWTQIDWDSLQTKIAAGATAKTSFADATAVDWSRVGQLGKLNWFYPMERYVATKALGPDMPQLSSFTVGGHVVGIPFDASFLVLSVFLLLFFLVGVFVLLL